MSGPERGDSVVIGEDVWEWHPEYGWVYVNEDDPVMPSEEAMLNRIAELEAEVQRYLEDSHWQEHDGLCAVCGAVWSCNAQDILGGYQP